MVLDIPELERLAHINVLRAGLDRHPFNILNLCKSRYCCTQMAQATSLD